MVDIFPKKIPPTPILLNFLFYFSLILLISVISGIFIVNNSIKKSQKSLEALEEVLVGEKTSENIALEKEILSYSQKIKDLSQIIDEHVVSSEFFTFLEKNSHPKVWFSQFNLDTEAGTVNLIGEAQSFESLGQQLTIFKKEELIKEINLEKIEITKQGKINFALFLSFSPIILK